MESEVNQRDSLQKQIQTSRASSSSAASSRDFPFERPEQINDHVYQVHKPAGRASVELVFFHGFQLEGSKEAYLTTWLSAEGSELWLTWILELFKDARILLVSYDASAQRKDKQGLMDMYLTCENLVQSLTEGEAKVGGYGSPVILVGHSIGGLVMKALCVTLDSTISRVLPQKQKQSVQNLMQNVKGLFYYACPHHGSRLADNSTDFPKGPFFEGMTTLNKEAERLNEAFRKLRLKHEWKTCGIGEGRPTTLGKFKDFIVAEASARGDVDDFYTCDQADHFKVCRPKCTISSNFIKLSSFIGSVLQQDQDQHSPKLCTPTGIYGLEGRVMDILEKLDKGARRLGIVGMGGIGKTTLAEAIYYTISGSFEYTCFLRDVKKFMAKKDNLEYLRKKIMKGLCFKGYKVTDNFKWEALKGKKVLIVLDDVEDEPQVQVMLESDGFSDDSCLIVTSRDSGFLRTENFEFYFVDILGKEDSKRIFCLNAFRKEVAEPGYEYRMEQFLKRCEGLPLALRVAGKYLYGQERRVWDDGLKKLKQAKPLNGRREDGLWSLLSVCYESLAEEEQEMFLDVATCFHNQDLETVKRAWSVCAWASPDAGLRNLVDKGLVSIEENNLPRQGRVIRMHEVLRDLGRRIACPNIENVATHTRLCYDLSNPQPMTQLLNEEKPQVKVLVINRFEDINIQSLDGLEELRILWLEDVSLRGPLNLLPIKLAYMKMIDSRFFDQREAVQPRKKRKTSRQHSALKQLEIDDCIVSEGFLESLGQCQALEHLEITSVSNWSALPESLGQLGALKHLRVASCNQLKSIPHSLGDLGDLKRLVIQDCQSIEAMPESLGRLQDLEHLEVTCGCSKAPASVVRQLMALRSLETTLCQDGEDLSDWLGQLKGLQKLVIHGCIDHGYPSITDQFNFLESLRRKRLLQDVGQVDLPMFCEDVVEIIDLNLERVSLPDFVRVGRVKKLLIKDCGNLEVVPDTLGAFQVLEDLKIVNCGSLKALPDSIGQLKSLQSLTILSCKSLKCLPDTLWNLQDLKCLVIGCGSFEAPFNNLRQLQDLRNLEIMWCHCHHQNSLLDILEQLHALQKLVIHGCPDHGNSSCTKQLEFLESLTRRGLLQGVGQVDIRGPSQLKISSDPEVKHLKSLSEAVRNLHIPLESLQINSCNSLESLPHSIGELRDLHQLEIKSCGNLKSLSEGFGNLGALKELHIEECNSLEVLPHSFSALPALSKFVLRSCGHLKSLPEDFGSLRALKELHIEDCNSLEVLPHSFSVLPALSKFVLRSCGHLKSLPADFGSLRALKELHIEEYNSLEVLPNYIWGLSSLSKFVLRSCGHLKSLPEAFWRLRALKELHIEDCNSLEVLPNCTWALPALSKFVLRSCGHLKSLPEAFLRIRALKELHIEDCNSLEVLPNCTWALPALSKIVLRSCGHLKSLPEDFGILEALKELHIEDCNSLEVLPHSFSALPALSKFVLRSCGHLKFPEAFWRLRALKELHIEDCNSLEVLPNCTWALPALSKFVLRSCGHLKSLPKDFWSLFALKELHIEECNSLQVLPNYIWGLESLSKFVLRSCGRLKSLPADFGSLRALKELHIEDCNSLEVLPHSFSTLPALSKFVLRSCGHLKSLPADFGKLSALKELHIEDCNSLEALPNSFWKLRAPSKIVVKSCGHLKSLPKVFGKVGALMELHIEDCNSLGALPDSVWKLRKLSKFVVKSCDHLKSLPEVFGKVGALKELHIEDCSSLVALPGSFWKLRSLAKFVAKSCGHLHSLSEGFGKLGALEELYIEDCNNLVALPDSFGKLRALWKCVLRSCGLLKSLPEGLEKLIALKELYIEDCNSLEALPESVEELPALKRFSCALQSSERS